MEHRAQGWHCPIWQAVSVRVCRLAIPRVSEIRSISGTSVQSFTTRLRTDHAASLRCRDKKSDKIGDRPVRSITPRAADKIYSIIITGPRGTRLRQAEKAIGICRHAWRVV